MRGDPQPLQERDEIPVDLKLLTGRRHDLAADRTRAHQPPGCTTAGVFPSPGAGLRPRRFQGGTCPADQPPNTGPPAPDRFGPPGDLVEEAQPTHRRGRDEYGYGSGEHPGQEDLVQPGPHAGLSPLSQPAPAGHARTEAEFLRQVLPGDPGVQDERDALEHLPVRMPLTPVSEIRGAGLVILPRTRHASLSRPVSRLHDWRASSCVCRPAAR